MSGELIDTKEMYLRTIYELHEEGIDPLRARIVERLHQSGPTVSQTVNRLVRDGLLTIEDDRHLQLTEAGWGKAVSVMRKHRLAECLLASHLGMSWPLLHDEACRLEHVMSDLMEEHIAQVLAEPTESPYGSPIPPDNYSAHPELFREGVQSVASKVATGASGPFTLVRISEFIQADAVVLSAIDSVGLRPGAVFSVQPAGADQQLAGPDGLIRVAPEVCEGLWVQI